MPLSARGQAGIASLLLLLGCAAPGSRSSPDNPEQPDVASDPPAIQGTLTRKASNSILIEEEPLDSSGSSKANVRISATTRVVTSSGKPAQPEDLRVGQRVSAWFHGPVMESYPLQGAASAVRIDSEEGDENQMKIRGVIRYYELEGGFYGIRAEDGETYNPINLPEEFRQDGISVSATIRPRNDMVGIHQAGPLVEIIEIERR